MLKEKELLVEEIKKNIPHLTGKKTLEKVKEDVHKYGITKGRVEQVIIHPQKLEEADIREVALLTEAFFKHSGTKAKELNPEEWFTENEMKEAYQYTVMPDETENFPFTLENVALVGNGIYSTAISIQQIAKWMDSQSLFYNYDIQRQAKVEVRNNEIIKTARVYKKNVEEMKDLLLKGELIVTTLAFNAAPQTAKNDQDELYYDAKNHTLTINAGTRLDILDGYHRCLASSRAVMENPDLDFNFNVLISNYTTREAQQYQAQLAQATPIDRGRIKELSANRYADTVINQLKAESELRGKISSSSSPTYTAGQIVSYSTLSDSIEREFDIKSKVQSREIAEYLGEFFDYLIGYNVENFDFRNKENLMWQNKMFAGYVWLAGYMYRENKKPSQVKELVKKIDFSRDNNDWVKIGYLNADKKVSTNRKTEKNIVAYFKEKIANKGEETT